MPRPFPDHPYLQGYYEPFGAELTAPDLVIEGDIPEAVTGTFYRNGPDPLHPPREGDKYHVFDGDGMVYAIALAPGRAAMRNRWVRTPKFDQELAAGKRLFGVFGNPMKSEPGINFMDYNTANTHIWPHAGRLFALMEGKPPVEMDPATLDTIGPETFAGAVTGPFTAHPKYDPASGNLYAFGYSAQGTGSTAVRYMVVDPAGRSARTAMVDQPYSSMMHDFMVTQSKTVFPCMPVVIDLKRAMQGKPLAAWESNRPSCFGMMSRDGDGSDIRWIETDPTFTFHFANAYDLDGAVVADAVISSRAPLMPDPDGTVPAHAATKFRLGRWTIRTDGGPGPSFKQEIWDDMDLQFPRFDERFSGKPYRYVFANGSTSASAGRLDGFDALFRYDLSSGRRDAYVIGAHAFAGEPVFVPRAADAAEGDGYLLSLVWHQDSNRSELLIMDATDLAGGPVARVRMPARVPGGFHCSWRPASTA
jgi:carotenoid cleavage dioxygenase-like enzyme